jgi:hypothetical protein
MKPAVTMGVGQVVLLQGSRLLPTCQQAAGVVASILDDDIHGSHAVGRIVCMSGAGLHVMQFPGLDWITCSWEEQAYGYSVYEGLDNICCIDIGSSSCVD